MVKYQSADEVLDVLDTLINAKETGSAVWCSELVRMPLDKLKENPVGKVPLIYKCKPLNIVFNKENVVMGSSNDTMFDYSASIKLSDSTAYKLVELIGEIVQSMTLAYKVLGDRTEYSDIDPVLQHILNDYETKYAVDPKTYKKLDPEAKKEAVVLTASELSSRAKEFSTGTKTLDLNLYPCYVTVGDKDGTREETVDTEGLKTQRHVN